MTTGMFPFIIGCPRSGTTLVRAMLDEHPQLAVFPESRFVTRYARHRRRWERAGAFDVDRFADDVLGHEKSHQWRLDAALARATLKARGPRTYPDAVRAIFAAYAEQHGKPLYGDKTPTYVVDVPLLAALFPEARFINVIRDGRDVALSLVENRFGPRTPADGMLYWKRRTEMSRKAACALSPGRYLEYRHEDLVDDPAGVLGRICDFLSLPFEKAMLDYHKGRERKQHYGSRNIDKPPTKRLRDWRTQMPPDQQRLCELIAGDLLSELGYERVTDERTAGAREAELRRRVALHQDWEYHWWIRVNRAPGTEPQQAHRPPSSDPEAD